MEDETMEDEMEEEEMEENEEENTDELEGEEEEPEERDEKEQRIGRNKDLVKKLVSFINSTSDPGPLLASLQETIANQFFAKVGRREIVRLDRPGLGLSPLHVDREGVLLLLHAREGLVLGRVRLGLKSGRWTGRNGDWSIEEAGDSRLTGAMLTALSCLDTG